MHPRYPIPAIPEVCQGPGARVPLRSGAPSSACASDEHAGPGRKRCPPQLRVAGGVDHGRRPTFRFPRDERLVEKCDGVR
eukprot:3152731-Pyramimonas_sp.AAC.1